MSPEPPPAGPRRARPISAYQPQAVHIAGGGDLVAAAPLREGGALPLLLRPAPGVDALDLPQWASRNRARIEAELARVGGLLFRGFDLGSQAAFERFVAALPLATMTYMEGATPRTQLSEKVYTSTEFPAGETIALHNELTYILGWPTRIAFCCLVAAASGGETPIADVRAVLKRLPRRLVDRFRDRGWMLVRNFGSGMSLGWRRAFHAETREEVERYCKEAAIVCEWLDGDRLRTRQMRPAVVAQPATGEEAWFNHVAFWHVSSLKPDLAAVLLAEFGEEGLPYNTYYGDGSPIPPEVVAEIRQAYQAETVAFPWQAGDLLLLDNVAVAHGRSPFTGERKVVVAMGDPSGAAVV